MLGQYLETCSLTASAHLFLYDFVWSKALGYLQSLQTDEEIFDLNELEALGEPDAFSETDKALAIIRALNERSNF